ncbi:hypothetical protein ACQY0O_006980 [Thecaphora frezii]
MDTREVAELLNVYLNANHVERFKPRMLRIREMLDDLAFGPTDGGASPFNAAAAAPYPDPGLQAAGVHAGPHQPYGALQDVTADQLELSQPKRQVEKDFDSSTIPQETGGLVANPHSGQRYFASESQRTSLLVYIKARLTHYWSLQGQDTSLVEAIRWGHPKWPHTKMH